MLIFFIYFSRGRVYYTYTNSATCIYFAQKVACVIYCKLTMARGEEAPRNVKVYEIKHTIFRVAHPTTSNKNLGREK